MWPGGVAALVEEEPGQLGYRSCPVAVGQLDEAGLDDLMAGRGQALAWTEQRSTRSAFLSATSSSVRLPVAR